MGGLVSWLIISVSRTIMILHGQVRYDNFFDACTSSSQLVESIALSSLSSLSSLIVKLTIISRDTEKKTHALFRRASKINQQNL